MAARRVERPLAQRPNEIWAMDFVSDALFNGRRFRALTVVDAYTRECLAIHADQGIKGEQVVDVMDRLLFERGSPPAKIRVDNGPEFISRALDHWAYINRVTLELASPPFGSAGPANRRIRMLLKSPFMQARAFWSVADPLLAAWFAISW
jgi:putative transposase